MLNALRLKQGFDLNLFEDRTGQSPLAIERQLQQAQDLGLLLIDNKQVQPSDEGYNFLNDLIEGFL